MGLLRMTLTHCLPRLVPIFTFVLAVLFLLAFAVVTFATSIVSSLLGAAWSIVFGVLLILLALILIVMLCMYSNEVKFQGYMLEYSVKFLNQNPHAFIYIPVFFLFHVGLVALILWQHSCYSSYYMGSGNFWKMTSSGFLDILNILEYLWGLQFLRDSCKIFILLRQLLCFWKCCRLVLDKKLFMLSTLPKTCLQKLGKRCWRIIFKCFLRSSNIACRTFCLSPKYLLFKNGNNLLQYMQHFHLFLRISKNWCILIH